ncbi:MAG: glycosyltransferase family 2 protein [Acutalibacteraceae bacterium]
MSADITVSASVVTYNDINRAPATCRSVVEHTKKYPLKLYVIDNASADGTADLIEKSIHSTVIRQGSNLGFGAAHNTVLKEPLGKYHFVVNPDITLNSDVIADMVDYFEKNPDVVMAMPKILNCDGSEQKLPKERPNFKRLFLGRLSDKIRSEYVWADKVITEPCDINFCSGCFFCIRSDVFKELGGFDERFFMYLEDADLALRAKSKGKVMFLPQISVTHAWERESSKSLKYLIIHIISCFKFLFKWRGRFK